MPFLFQEDCSTRSGVVKMEVSQADGLNLVEVSRFVTAGYIYSGWRLIKPLLGTIEQDQVGHYYISNEALGLYAVGVTQADALADFMTSLIYNYQLLQRRIGNDPDLAALFQEYKKYLQIEVATAGEGLRKSFIGQNESPNEAGVWGSWSLNIDLEVRENLDQFTLDELALLISLLAEYRAKAPSELAEGSILPRPDLVELGLLESKLIQLMALATGEAKGAILPKPIEGQAH
jgi:hypothetical protein